MRSRALAMAFGRHPRWGAIAFAGYLLFLVTFQALFLEPGRVVRLHPPDGAAGIVIAPFSMLFLYFVGVFTFGFSGDLTARQSIYPARLFTLPVTTRALAGWPMLYGTVVMAGMYVASALVVRGAWGIVLPLIWPALLVAAFLAWAQALTWMPYGLPGMRVIATVMCLIALDAVVLFATYFETSEPLMIAFLAPQLLLAFLVAHRGVARARCGDVPDWRGMLARGKTLDVPTKRRSGFPSPARAQAWFEWRQHGWSLPGWVGLLLPFELALLFLARSGAPSLVFFTLVVVLGTPIVMAAFVAPAQRGVNAHVPLTSAALVAAKLRMTIWTTLAAWLLVLVAIPLALTLSGTWPEVLEPAREGIDAVGMPRACVIMLLLLAALVASTWKQLVQSLYIGLTGRTWLIRANAALLMAFLIVVGPLAAWILKNRELLAALWDALPWILAILACVKLSAAAWVATRLYQTRLVSDRTLVTGAAAWLAAVVALRALLVWFVDAPDVPHYYFTLIAILAIPLARVSAAPLALAWNRHR